MFPPSHLLQRFVYFLLVLISFNCGIVRAVATDIRAGQACSLSISADGTSPFSYQWFHDGTVMTGVTGPVYLDNNIQAEDAGVYYAVVSNSVGSTTSDSVTIAVIALPVFTTGPVGQTVTMGNKATFTVAASGLPAPTYQWFKNGLSLAGANGSTYAIANTLSTDAGVYTVVATNRAGSVTSSAANLAVSIVTIVPVFTTQPVSQTVTTGSAVTFTASAGGSPAPAYQWKKNGVAISGANGSSYAITNTTSGHAGTYTVTATNAAGTITSKNAVLSVNVPPSFTTQPVGKTITAGSSVTFNALATGSPAAAYQWRKDGANLSGATNASYSISNVSSSSAGTYTVVATNSAGTVVSSGAVLTVKAASIPPAFTIQPVGKTVLAGNAVTFTASASGSPSPVYQWRKNGVNINGATGSSYVIASAAMVDTGTYSVVATNSAGSLVSGSAALGVTESLGNRVDFNGDGQNDLVWQNISTGECLVWLMSGTKNTAKVTIGTFATSWRLSGAGDFNADGKADLVWQSGEKCFISLMSGTSITAQVSMGKVGSGWEIKGAGDYDGSGQSDLLFQNSVTGECSIWLMSGTTVTSKVSLGTVDLAWEICGSGDFNSDGKSDVIWQNILTGERSIWLMSGTNVTGKVSLGILYPDWEMGCAGDFNGDGQTDILWQNLETGKCFIWLMAGTQFTDIVSLGTQSPAWVVGN